jgi:hypothetical protein
MVVETSVETIGAGDDTTLTVVDGEAFKVAFTASLTFNPSISDVGATGV